MPGMETEKLKSWAEFKTRISDIEEGLAKYKAKAGGYFSHPLFRGLTKDSWKLETSLERVGHREMSIKQYHRITASAHRLIGNIGMRKHEFNESPALDYDAITRGLPNYEFLGYLRHHGFPSPLLDWSRSPYVAAYFAYKDKPTDDGSPVAIYLYVEAMGQGKSSAPAQGGIHTLGLWAAIHERHLTQQCEYTFCCKTVGEEVFFCPHGDALASNDHNQWMLQDFLIRFTLPASERTAALQDLNQMNITPFSLFASEEALIATAAMMLFDNIGK